MARTDMERLFASSTDPSARSSTRGHRGLIITVFVVLAYGLAIGTIAGSLLDVAPYSSDPDRFQAMGGMLLWPLGMPAYWLGALVRAAVATAAGDAVGLLVAWFVYAVIGVVIALSQATLVAVFVGAIIRVARRRY